jgi:hypothetical protein
VVKVDLKLGEITGLVSRMAALGEEGADADLSGGAVVNTPGVADGGIHHRALPILRDFPHLEFQRRELVHLELEVVDNAFDAGTPFVEPLGGGLEHVEAGGGRR